MLAMRNQRFLGIGQLGRRLVLAFIAVALAAIAVNAAVSAENLGSDIGRVVVQQERSLAEAAGVTAGAAYQGIGWRRADLDPVYDLARHAGAAVQVRDMAHRVVGSSPRFATFPVARARIGTIETRGRPVGSITVRFSHKGIGAIVRQFESRRLQSRLIAAGIAALIALAVSLVVARAIGGPLELLLEAVRARGEGGRSVRIKNVRGIGVVRELLRSFNRTADALDERDRLQRNLVADVAHELRTPVAVLQASHEAMLDGITEPSRENLESLREEVLRLAHIVDDLQRLAAAEAAALQLTLAPQDLATIAAEAAGNLGGSFGTAGVCLVRRLTEVHVRCNADRMREVISNLLTNALKFTPTGGDVVLETGAGGSGQAMVRIGDTGIGIQPDELPHVTERFFRGVRAPQMSGGSGIGLTIATELVRAHGGELAITSKPGSGTQVTVLLPAIDPVESRRLALLRSATGQSAWPRGT
jgi:two-component system sensor histidine kinase BaeS